MLFRSLGTVSYARLRLGIGMPKLAEAGSKTPLALEEYVLSTFALVTPHLCLDADTAQERYLIVFLLSFVVPLGDKYSIIVS